METLTKPRPARGILPPAVWVCPQCSSKVVTHIPTYTPECRSSKHRGTLVYMEVKS